MAVHNQVRVVGYVKGEVTVLGEGVPGGERVLVSLRTMPREIDIYQEEKFQDIMVFYDGKDESLMARLKHLHAYDIVDIKGVFNVLTLNKHSACPYCGSTNVKYRASSTFVYPIHMMKLNALYTAYEHDNALPEQLLAKHYREISNQAIICGTVVSEPDLKPYGKSVFCKYQLGINRKYYISTQDDVTADYIWVYTFGDQAEDDARHLIPEATVLMDGFMRNRKVEVPTECSTCGRTYLRPDVTTEFIPYSLEYLKGHLTDEDLAKQEAERRQEQYSSAKKQIFG